MWYCNETLKLSYKVNEFLTIKTNPCLRKHWGFTDDIFNLGPRNQ